MRHLFRVLYPNNIDKFYYKKWYLKRSIGNSKYLAKISYDFRK